ncbi:hypothetical protein HDV01_001246 [Terramyces sp. JEL0728]|nr:hypothetical protein HDV01_001246 [Terramyces sp. JEL0728]
MDIGELSGKIIKSERREQLKLIHGLNDMMLLSLSKAIRYKFKSDKNLQYIQIGLAVKEIYKEISTIMASVLESRGNFIYLNELNQSNLARFITEFSGELITSYKQDEKAWKLLKVIASRGLINQQVSVSVLSSILELLENDSRCSVNLTYILSKIIPLLPADTYSNIAIILLKFIKRLNLNITNITKYGVISSLILEDIVLLLKSNHVRTIVGKQEHMEIFSRLISLFSKSVIAFHNQSQQAQPNDGVESKFVMVNSHTLQIFTLLKYTCQIMTTVKHPTAADLKKILFIFKFLIANIDDMEEFEPDDNMSDVEGDQESQYNRTTLIEILRPSLLFAATEYILQLFKLSSCNFNIKDYVVWIKIMQLIETAEYILKYSAHTTMQSIKSSIVKILAFVWTDFLKNPEPDLMLINKSLIPCLVSPCGIIIQNYFSGAASATEFNAGLVLLSKFLLFRSYKNISIDSGLLDYIASSSYIDACLAKENFVYLQCIEKICNDSSVRFKLSNAAPEKNILNFMTGNALSFLNQHFGHDKVICDLFCTNDDSTMAELVQLLTSVIADMLSLDLMEATTNLTPHTIIQISHFLDSLLRFEKPQVYVLSHNLIRDLAKIMLQINHSDVPEIFSKVIGRILTDPNLTLRIVKYLTIPKYYESIYPNTANKVQEILESHLPQYQPIMLSLLEYNNSDVDFEVQSKCVLALGYVSSKQLVRTVLSSLPYTEGGISKSQAFQIMSFILEINELESLYLSSAQMLIQHMAIQIPAAIQSLGPSYYFAKESKPKPQSSLIQHILYAHEPISVQLTDTDNIVTFLLPDDPNYHTIRCKCDKKVFCEQSAVFAQMLDSTFIEGQSQVITIPQVTRRSWFLLMDWINLTKVWSDSVPFQKTQTSDVELVFQVMQVADKYILNELYQVCADWITDLLHYAAHKNLPDICRIIYSLICTKGEFMKNVEYCHINDLCVRAVFATQSFKK